MSISFDANASAKAAAAPSLEGETKRAAAEVAVPAVAKVLIEAEKKSLVANCKTVCASLKMLIELKVIIVTKETLGKTVRSLLPKTEKTDPSKKPSRSEMALQLILSKPELLDLTLSKVILHQIETGDPGVTIAPYLFKSLSEWGYFHPRYSAMTCREALADYFHKWLSVQSNLSDLSHLVQCWYSSFNSCIFDHKIWTSIKDNSLIKDEQKEFAHNIYLLFFECHKYLLLDCPLDMLETYAPKGSVTAPIPKNNSDVSQMFNIWASHLHGVLKGIEEARKEFKDVSPHIVAETMSAAALTARRKKGAILHVNNRSLLKFAGRELTPFEGAEPFKVILEKRLTLLVKEINRLSDRPEYGGLMQIAMIETTEVIYRLYEGMVKAWKEFKKTKCDDKIEALSKKPPKKGKDAESDKAKMLFGDDDKLTRFKEDQETWGKNISSLEPFLPLTRCFTESLKREAQAVLGMSEAEVKSAAAKTWNKEAIMRRMNYTAIALEDLIEELGLNEIEQVEADKKEKKSTPAKGAHAAAAKPVAETEKPVLANATADVQLSPLAGFEKDLSTCERVFAERVKELEKNRSLVKAMSPFADVVAKGIELSFSKHPDPQMVREIADHLFLQTQGLEMFSTLVLQKRFDCLPVCLRSYMIDCHVAVEQRLGLEIFKKTGVHSQEHSLVQRGRQSGMALGDVEKRFLEECNESLSWARYPACSKHFFGKNLPSALQILLQLSEKQDKESIAKAIEHLFQSYERSLCIVLQGTPLMSEATLKSFVAECGKLKTALLLSLDEPNTVVAGVKKSPSKFQDAKAAFESLFKECLYLPHAAIDPLTSLEEVLYYLRWIDQAEELRTSFPEASFEFWHVRNQLDIEKLFKHLYTAECAVHEIGHVRRHSFHDFIELLEERNVRKFNRSRDFLLSINMKIAHHYHTKQSPMQAAYCDLVARCRASAGGFSLSKSRAVVPDFFQKGVELFLKQFQEVLEAAKELDSRLRTNVRTPALLME